MGAVSSRSKPSHQYLAAMDLDRQERLLTMPLMPAFVHPYLHLSSKRALGVHRRPDHAAPERALPRAG